MGNTTIGNNYNIECPYCSKTNHYPIDTLVVSQDGFNYDVIKPCWHCKRIVRYLGVKGKDQKGFPEIKITALIIS